MGLQPFTMGNPRKTIKVAGMLALMTTSASMAAFVAAGAEPPDRPALHLALSNTQYSLCDSGDFYEHTHYTSDPSSEGFPAGELVQAFTEDVALAYSHAALSSIPDVDRAASQRLYELSASRVGRSFLSRSVMPMQTSSSTQ